MYSVFLITTLVVSLSLLLPSAFAESISLNKEKFVFDDTIIISGKVSYDEGNFIGLQILNPSKTDIVVIDQFFPQTDGSFSKSYKAKGPKWSADGIYFIKLVYNEQVYEKQFSFEKIKEKEETTSNDSQQQSSELPRESSKETKLDPKLQIKGFPNPEKSPNYYLERYAKDNQYRDWFDSSFEDYTILEVVGYPTTHIREFPDNDNPPWHYVDRYNSEEDYRDWFDSQFPTKSIFDVLAYPESLFQKVPDWIKNNARWWSSGLISDHDFLKGIEYLISEKIIVIPNLPEPGVSQTKTIPVWIKNTAKWWADGLIDENEFLKGISFLIENKIILV